MDNLPKLLSEMRQRYPDSIPPPVFEAYCQRYLYYYHRQIKNQPAQFISGWRWAEARRREFRSAFEVTDLQKIYEAEAR